MMRTGTGRTKYGHKREGNAEHGEHRSDITPPPLPLMNGASRTIHHPTGRGGGALEASRNMETGQEASRAAPVPGSTSGELGWPRRIRELGRPRQSRGFRMPWRDRLRGRSPSPHPGLSSWSPTTTKKNSLGEVGARSGTWGHSGSADTLGHSGSAGTAKRIRGAGTGGCCRGAGTSLEPQAGLPYSLQVGLLWPQTAAGLRGPRTAGVNEPRNVAGLHGPRTAGVNEPRTHKNTQIQRSGMCNL